MKKQDSVLSASVVTESIHLKEWFNVTKDICSVKVASRTTPRSQFRDRARWVRLLMFAPHYGRYVYKNLLYMQPFMLKRFKS